MFYDVRHFEIYLKCSESFPAGPPDNLSRIEDKALLETLPRKEAQVQREKLPLLLDGWQPSPMFILSVCMLILLARDYRPQL